MNREKQNRKKTDKIRSALLGVIRGASVSRSSQGWYEIKAKAPFQVFLPQQTPGLEEEQNSGSTCCLSSVHTPFVGPVVLYIAGCCAEWEC